MAGVPTYSAPVPGLVLTDHRLEVPLDHSDGGGPALELYAREVRAIEKADDDLPWLLFLQGGPGGKSPRPLTRSGWLDEAVKDYRVLLMDQRGTGRSTPITVDPPARFRGDADALAEYLAHFRADAIVRDAELLRAAVGGGAPWTTLGQSYGGFCTFTYLSLAPEGLRQCLITGGVPPLTASAADVYRRTWPRVLAKNAEHRRRFPEDAAVLERVRAVIRARQGAGDPVRLPGGDPLTVPRLQALGIAFGMSTGYASVHYLLEEAFAHDELSPAFLVELEQRTQHADSPLYAVLQEVIYCSGTASRWAAERVRRAEFPQFDADAAQLLLTGEMKESAVFTDEAALTPFAGAMALLNAKTDWPNLYDTEVLADNRVPVAAVIYHDDMYVDADFSLQTAADTPQVRTWVTNEFEHDGLRAEARVFSHLRDLVTGRA